VALDPHRRFLSAPFLGRIVVAMSAAVTESAADIAVAAATLDGGRAAIARLLGLADGQKQLILKAGYSMPSSL